MGESAGGADSRRTPPGLAPAFSVGPDWPGWAPSSDAGSCAVGRPNETEARALAPRSMAAMSGRGTSSSVLASGRRI